MTRPAAEATSSLSSLSMLELALLGAIWGASFLFMRIAVPDFGALPLVEVRLALGALILLPFLWQAREKITGGLWLRLFGIAAVNSAIPFALFAWAAERAPAGIGAITNSMTVLFTALVAFAMYRDPIGARRGIGLVAGFIGVVVLASGRIAGASIGLAALAGTSASFLYGIGVNLVRRYLVGVPASALASATLVCGTILLLPFAIATWPEHPVAPASWLSAILLGGVCTGIAFTLYYRLIHRIGATRAAAVTYLIPLFGLLWAWLFLGEAPTATMGLAAVMILGGVALSQSRARSR